jgi:rare lipoprotein A
MRRPSRVQTAAAHRSIHARTAAAVAPPKPKPDLTGKKRLGIASFYADNFGGKPMADGVPMNLDGDNAASRTLPLGTKAKVTNLETGKSATVVIEDRGPYVDGRIVDLSPATARKIGITRRQGISKVAVVPITVPQPDGTVKLGAAAREPGPVREASLETAARSR